MTENATIYLAGGCFWGVQKLIKSLPGVLETVCGYANGSSEADARYEIVCGGRTGFRETVKVVYDPSVLPLEALLAVYFYVIDPTQEDRQGPDCGTQYQTGVYYTDEDGKKTAERVAAIESAAIPPHLGYFSVEIEPLVNFFPAEDYHQDYLDKNPRGYCHISRALWTKLPPLPLASIRYDRPAKILIDELLAQA